ncbi:MAG TPA: lmo0937 family membrane protein [Chthonomonadaceae bacterium]|nr:lmo0937 family membrane protein [Chthonomonadaceae bacterium]
MASLLWTVIVILFVLWLLGLLLHFGGSLIHILLVAAVVILVYNLLTKGKATL